MSRLVAKSANQLSRRRETGRKSYYRGLFCEFLVRLFLFCKGYRCLGHRLRTPVGEVDLVCHKGRDLVIVEVKSGAGILERDTSAIGYKQACHLRKAGAYLYARQRQNWSNSCIDGLRFDMVLVDIGRCRLKHYRNIEL